MPDVREVCGSNSRDLSVLVKQVKEVLPQYSEDLCCQALVEADEDVMQAVALLLERPSKPKAKPRKAEKAAAAEASSAPGSSGHAGGEASGHAPNCEEEAPQKSSQERRP